MTGDILNPSGEKLDYAFHPGAGGSKRLALIGHGVTGNKDRAWALALAERLASDGIHACRFSFAGNGESGGAFADCTITKEVGDLGAMIDAAAAQGYQVAYIGHSMGGAVGVLRAASDDRIKWLVSLAGMVHTKKFYDTEFGGETPDSGCMWEDESCPLSSAYQADMAAIGSVAPLGAKIGVPWLLVHGTADDVVPYQESLDIIAEAQNDPELFTIEGGDHVFNGPACDEMAARVTGWLQAQP